jgi:hypothetical protein
MATCNAAAAPRMSRDALAELFASLVSGTTLAASTVTPTAESMPVCGVVNGTVRLVVAPFASVAVVQSKPSPFSAHVVPSGRVGAPGVDPAGRSMRVAKSPAAL